MHGICLDVSRSFDRGRKIRLTIDLSRIKIVNKPRSELFGQLIEVCVKTEPPKIPLALRSFQKLVKWPDHTSDGGHSALAFDSNILSVTGFLTEYTLTCKLILFVFSFTSIRSLNDL